MCGILVTRNTSLIQKGSSSGRPSVWRLRAIRINTSVGIENIAALPPLVCGSILIQYLISRDNYAFFVVFYILKLILNVIFIFVSAAVSLTVDLISSTSPECVDHTYPFISAIITISSADSIQPKLSPQREKQLFCSKKATVFHHQHCTASCL